MTLQEKALSLCQSFGYLGLKSEQTNYVTLDLDLAKQCALIAVQREIEAVKFVIQKSTGIYQTFNTPVKLCIDILNPLLSELEEVKQAIQAL